MDQKFCVLIPSRQRVDILRKSLQKMPWLNTPHTAIGFERDEADAYITMLHKTAPLVKVAIYENPTGSVAVAREQLRRIALLIPYKYYVVTDDNAVHKSEHALHNLVRCAAEWPTKPVIMAGMHNTAIHFDRTKLHLKKTINGLTSYPTVAMMFQVYDRALYKDYAYPADAYGLDDRHLVLWAIKRGVREFRVCMDAPFTKSRYDKKKGEVAGGQGTIPERMHKCGLAIARLATDFPQYVGATGTLRIPWSFVLDMEDGHTADRLVGGAMRKAEAIVSPHKPSAFRIRTTPRS
jgi:hypothetical protein